MSHIIRKAGDAPIDANRELRAITRVRRDEAMWAFVTVAGVILIGTLPGILIAVAISLLTLMYQAIIRRCMKIIERSPLEALGAERIFASLHKAREEWQHAAEQPSSAAA